MIGSLIDESPGYFTRNSSLEKKQKAILNFQIKYGMDVMHNFRIIIDCNEQEKHV
jgi:hypothetical protein